MTLSVILDTDFLSAFLKIDRLSLVRDFYQVEQLVIPPAVYREISFTHLVQYLERLSWVQIEAPSAGSCPESQPLLGYALLPKEARPWS